MFEIMCVNYKHVYKRNYMNKHVHMCVNMYDHELWSCVRLTKYVPVFTETFYCGETLGKFFVDPPQEGGQPPPPTKRGISKLLELYCCRY